MPSAVRGAATGPGSARRRLWSVLAQSCPPHSGPTSLWSLPKGRPVQGPALATTPETTAPGPTPPVTLRCRPRPHTWYLSTSLPSASLKWEPREPGLLDAEETIRTAPAAAQTLTECVVYAVDGWVDGRKDLERTDERMSRCMHEWMNNQPRRNTTVTTPSPRAGGAVAGLPLTVPQTALQPTGTGLPGAAHPSSRGGPSSPLGTACRERRRHSKGSLLQDGRPDPVPRLPKLARVSPPQHTHVLGHLRPFPRPS